MGKLKIGDPTRRGTLPRRWCSRPMLPGLSGLLQELSAAGDLAAGGNVLQIDGLEVGLFVEPTLAVDMPLDHQFWKKELPASVWSIK